MRKGQLIADRFELEAIIAQGAMGDVWRGSDRATREPVAIKVMRAGTDPARFAREMQLLPELQHPAIVRHIAHGNVEGSLFVAMEWLDGCDLSSRLARGALTIAESVALAHRICSALAVVHARGVVHRDVKPSNVFLPRARPDEAKLLDFGVARTGMTSLTNTGAAIGTPGYMAPEQARGMREVDARADVFSVGCVLYECITGEPAFSGDHLVAILAKVLMQDAPRVSERVKNAPPEIDALVARMLAKDPNERPRDGAECVTLLERVMRAPDLGSQVSLKPEGKSAQRPPSSSLSAEEEKLASVVLVGAPPAGHSAADTLIERERLLTIASSHGAHVEMLAEGSALAIVSTKGTAKDRATSAARFALALHRAIPARACALATGHGSIDRVSKLALVGAAGVRVDDAAAGLLDARFVIAESMLRAERERVEPVRTLLGKPVPFVGRDKELRTLEALYEEAAEEPCARACVVISPAGNGKSRIAHELVRRLEEREIRVWTARADPMSTGSPLAMLADALRRVFALRPGEPLPARRETIRARSPSNDVAWFLGEIVGVPFEEKESVQIAAARRDPQLMADQMRRAFEELVLAQTKHPLAIVLEDLHWGDSATVSFLDSTLRVAKDRPLFLVVTARPEVTEMFPNLWSARGVQIIRLLDLGAKASEKLVRSILENASDDVVSRLVERAAGNALFLEELVRAHAEGRGDTPESVLAMMHSRLESLDADLRRTLRAASVFGGAFWTRAIEPLVGANVANLLEELERRELVARNLEGRFPGEEEHVFRHDLVREAAYAMLTKEDRALAHLHAAEWLEKAGESDALVLAEHCEKGDDPDRAIPHYLAASKSALAANDLDAALARADRALAYARRSQKTAHEIGELEAVRAEVLFYRGAREDTLAACGAALRDLPAGTPIWAEIVQIGMFAASGAGDLAKVTELGKLFCTVKPSDASVVSARYRAGQGALQSGMPDLATSLTSDLPELEDPIVRYRMNHYLAGVHMRAGDIGGALMCMEFGVAFADQSGNRRLACGARSTLGYLLCEVGDYTRAIEVLELVIKQGDRMGMRFTADVAKQNLGLARTRRGDIDLGIELLQESADGFARIGDKRLEGGTRIYLATAWLEARALPQAEHEARAAIACLESVPPLRPMAIATLARVLVARGRASDALVLAREAHDFIEKGGHVEEGESNIRLAWVEALGAVGLEDEARQALLRASARLRERALLISSEKLRKDFLERIPENAKTLEMSAKFGA